MANAALRLPPSPRPGPELVDHHLDLGGAPGRANTGDKMLTLRLRLGSIDDADALAGRSVFSLHGQGPSTLGTFLARWGHVRQLSVTPVAGPGMGLGPDPEDSPLTIDLDSTICETYGLARRERATTATPAREGITRCYCRRTGGC